MYELALIYEEGVVCQKNYKKAFELYEKAAGLKNPLGKYLFNDQIMRKR